MDTCIFCKIVAGKIPSTRLHEDEKAIVFLDINQSARGHLLVVPRAHAGVWHELDGETAAHLAQLALRLAPSVLRSMKADGYNLVVNNGEAAGQEVMHVHLHLIPRWNGDHYIRLGVPARTATPDELRATAERILGDGD